MLIIHNIPMALRSAYLSMHRQTDTCCTKHGITANQFVLLMLLTEEDGITQQTLVRRAFSDPNTIRAMLVLLEKSGLVVREQHPSDGRKRRVTITCKGRRIYESVLKESKPVRQQMLALFSKEEIKMLTVFLSRISEAMTENQ
jgi:DNA-binding MarR family transcriptional regulator